jgi:hypothetical protein
MARAVKDALREPGSAWPGRRRRLLADQLGLVAGNDVNETDEIKRVLPVDDQKSGGLIVQIKILAQEAPEGERPGAGRGRLWIVAVVAKDLDVADDVSFGSQSPFEGRAGSEAVVVIDGQDTFAQIE